MLNLLAQARDALGALDRSPRSSRCAGSSRARRSSPSAPRVIDGASDLLAAVFGERGAHARSAIGAAALPLGFAVEVEMVVEVRRP